MGKSLPTLCLHLNSLLMFYKSSMVSMRTAVFETLNEEGYQGRANTLLGGVRKAAWHIVGTHCTFVK